MDLIHPVHWAAFNDILWQCSTGATGSWEGLLCHCGHPLATACAGRRRFDDHRQRASFVAEPRLSDFEPFFSLGFVAMGVDPNGLHHGKQLRLGEFLDYMQN